MAIEIVKMEEKHIPIIAELEKECFSEPWSAEQIREELSNDCAFYFVAESQSHAVGYIGCHIVLDEGYITNVAVNGDFRKQGIGHALVSQMSDVAKQKMLSFITLEARTSNESAIKLYEKNGFMTAGIRRNFYTAPVEDAVLMTLYLKKDEH